MNRVAWRFREWTPANSLVTGGGSSRFALAEADHQYLVYSTGGSFDLNVSGTGLMAQWFNPRNPDADLGIPFAVSPGNVAFTPPAETAKDWVLWVTDGTIANDPVIHPSGDAELVQNFVGPEPTSILAWEFNTDGDREGWQDSAGATSLGVGGGSWNLVMSGARSLALWPGIQ